MSEKLGRDVNIEEAAQDWYTHYHLPAILLLRKHLTTEQDPLQTYFAIMDRKWKLSKRAGYEIPLDEAVVDWAMRQAEKGTLGTFDPAAIARWWREREPVTKALEPPLIESEKLELLLSKEEQQLAHMPEARLDEELTSILEHQKPKDEAT